MGTRFEIHGWLPDPIYSGFRYDLLWQGQSRIKAFWKLWRYKRSKKYGCVKLEWR